MITMLTPYVDPGENKKYPTTVDFSLLCRYDHDLHPKNNHDILVLDRHTYLVLQGGQL